jgi:hypothetical protein
VKLGKRAVDVLVELGWWLRPLQGRIERAIRDFLCPASK